MSNRESLAILSDGALYYIDSDDLTSEPIALHRFWKIPIEPESLPKSGKLAVYYDRGAQQVVIRVQGGGEVARAFLAGDRPADFTREGRHGTSPQFDQRRKEKVKKKESSRDKAIRLYKAAATKLEKEVEKFDQGKFDGNISEEAARLFKKLQNLERRSDKAEIRASGFGESAYQIENGLRRAIIRARDYREEVNSAQLRQSQKPLIDETTDPALRQYLKELAIARGGRL